MTAKITITMTFESDEPLADEQQRLLQENVERAQCDLATIIGIAEQSWELSQEIQ